MIRRIVNEWKEEYKNSAIDGLMLLFVFLLFAGSIAMCALGAIAGIVSEIG